MQPNKQSLSLELSPELLKAQEKLLNLRAERGIAPQPRVEPPWQTAPALQGTNWALRNAQIALQQQRLQLGVAAQAPCVTSSSIEPLGQGEGDLPPSNQGASSIASASVIAHPTMLLAMLKQNLEAPGRVYFLLRSIDTHGRGWLEIADIRQMLTAKDSPWRICGWRRLRQLLKLGEDIFWQRDSKDRLWLKGAHKIAYALDCGRLLGFPIRLPISSLLGGIQAVRGSFYAAFHSGRASNPISRHTLCELSGVPERTQRSYDRVARVQRQANIAIGERYSKETIEARAWQQGRAVFHFIDSRGLQGKPQAEYLAWHLPNSYTGPHERRSRANRKRVNRKLADLVKKGIPGTSEQKVEQLFWPNGAQAAKGYSRDPQRDAYWLPHQSSQSGQLWRVMSGCSWK
jgi:hypothetical protein